MARRLQSSPGLRWPKWLKKYEVWHPLHSAGFDIVKERAFLHDARRFTASRALLGPAQKLARRFADTSLPQRTRFAAGVKAADMMIEAQQIARARKAELEGRPAGEWTSAGVRVNGTATSAIVWERLPRTIIDRSIARSCGVTALGRAGSVVFKGERLQGRFVAMKIGFEGRAAEIVAFVPARRFKKGLFVGTDWLDRAGFRFVAGELERRPEQAGRGRGGAGRGRRR